MPPKKQDTIWPAKPHTIAKIKILEGYLDAWFPIFGQSQHAVGQDLLFVDGFAGPGKYTNYPTGSPIAALGSGVEARKRLGSKWKAGDIHYVFIENDRSRFDHLTEHVEPFKGMAGISIDLIHSTFLSGLPQVKRMFPNFADRSLPMFIFIDPFGATGAPFHLVQEILGSPRSEVLINFDTDAVGRIFRAGGSANHDQLLDEIYGDDSWNDLSLEQTTFENQCRIAVQLYKRRLRSLPRVSYAFSFEMLNESGTVGYDLIFASQHPTGLVKMKEAMTRLDQRGDYTFSDAHVGQPTLFRFDQPKEFAGKMHREFSGLRVRYAEVIDFALNETPFKNAKSMLAVLEQQGHISVVSRNRKRRSGQFPEESVQYIEFSEVDDNG